MLNDWMSYTSTCNKSIMLTMCLSWIKICKFANEQTTGNIDLNGEYMLMLYAMHTMFGFVFSFLFHVAESNQPNSFKVPNLAEVSAER